MKGRWWSIQRTGIVLLVGTIFFRVSARTRGARSGKGARYGKKRATTRGFRRGYV